MGAREESGKLDATADTFPFSTPDGWRMLFRLSVAEVLVNAPGGDRVRNRTARRMFCGAPAKGNSHTSRSRKKANRPLVQRVTLRLRRRRRARTDGNASGSCDSETLPCEKPSRGRYPRSSASSSDVDRKAFRTTNLLVRSGRSGMS